VRAAAIVAAGGSGSRFGRREGKQTAVAGGLPLLAWSVAACASAAPVELIVVVGPADRLPEYLLHAREAAGGVPIVGAESGETRQDSVWSGLILIDDSYDVVVVHDGARPLATHELVTAAIERLEADAGCDGVIAAHPSVDTVKVVAGDTVVSTPDRATLWAVQTPQVFRRRAIVEAYERAAAEGFVGTDDASLVERASGRVVVIEGPRDNIKVTCAEDLVVADAVLRARMEER